MDILPVPSRQRLTGTVLVHRKKLARGPAPRASRDRRAVERPRLPLGPAVAGFLLWDSEVGAVIVGHRDLRGWFAPEYRAANRAERASWAMEAEP